MTNKNLRKFERKLNLLCSQHKKRLVDYDKIYDFLEGWCAYAKRANTYKLRKVVLQFVEEKFAGEVSTKEANQHLKN